MKKQILNLVFVILLVPGFLKAQSRQSVEGFLATSGASRASNDGNQRVIGKLSTGAVVSVKQGHNGKWGIFISHAGDASLKQPQPVKIHWYRDPQHVFKNASGYSSVKKIGDGFLGKATIKIHGASFQVADYWNIDSSVLTLSRHVEVHGYAVGGFLSAIKLLSQEKKHRSEVDYFAPGMIYGSSAHVTKTAIGGKKAGLKTWIREDRLPAPMFGIYFKDGSSVTILDPDPRGNTTKADSHNLRASPLVDARFKFGSMGAAEVKNHLKIGFMWPGTEGETTYKGYFYPGGQLHKWRRVYHPIKDGFIQQYKVSFRFQKNDKDFKSYYASAWRWVWDTLNPEVNKQNISLAWHSIIKALSSRVETTHGVTSISNYMPVTRKYPFKRSNRTTMGFTGKALDAARHLLEYADINPSSGQSKKYRKQALAIIHTFMKLDLSPPEGVGFSFATGKPVSSKHGQKIIYLRNLGDGMAAFLKTALWEKEHGRSHPGWVEWARSFGDWLLGQQNKEGGFPRSWQPNGEVVSASGLSSYNAIPFLVLLSKLTDDPKYLNAAIKAGNYCWNNGQSEGIFVGGTIDNPDVVDKEAGTLSMEAYLALYKATQDHKWLKRAATAANFSETWIYIWNVPMPAAESNKDLHWKKGVSTIGLQLISTGHSLVDEYMAREVGYYAKLSDYTEDNHYLKVAKILLHNTKGMLALPGRTYDLLAPGLQQEHWSLAPIRGYGRKRAWLPWVATSQLDGISGLYNYDKKLFKRLTK